MINYLGHKCTANEFAKLIVSDKGYISEYWTDDSYDIKGFTDKEIEKCDIAINKHLNRVRKYLGIREIWQKISTKKAV